VAVEKNIEAFVALDLPGTKVVVGRAAAGGAEEQLPEGGVQGPEGPGEELAGHYACADVFVFPRSPTPSAW
jgi:hypothetical protein